ncbi:MAG TPA: hypothetical protein VFG50_06020 [Rhodothermales bacterium]|nr:hypothetical protein [Rhodothermales bacterium]
MDKLKLNLDELTLDEAVLFAFRYRLIDDCHPEGEQYRLTLGNQTLLLAPEQLTTYLHVLLQRYQRTVEEDAGKDGLPPGHG